KNVCFIINDILTAVITTSCAQEKRIVRVPYHWYLMERDRRVSGTGAHYHAKGLENIN
uniref:Uncharacterized protein n=1 Tax=Cyprinus carpio TaxID=7962 RepID=A0A8C2D8F9_CYPCA